jgi:hypothetical protein
MPKLMEETLQALERGDAIAIVWSVEDVLCMSEDEDGNETVTRDEAHEILQQLYEDHNANYGISWDTIYQAVNHYKRLSNA